MRIVFTELLRCEGGKIYAIFNVVGDQADPGVEGAVLGSGNMTFHSEETAGSIAEGIWEEAEAIREAGCDCVLLHRQVLKLLRGMSPGQVE